MIAHLKGGDPLCTVVYHRPPSATDHRMVVGSWQHRNVRLTDASAAGWDRLCTRRGVTLTALLEALGELLNEGDEWTPEQAIERARQIDSARRSRR